MPVEWSSKKLELVDYTSMVNRYFVRTTADKDAVGKAFGKVEYVEAEGVTGENGFITEAMSEADYAAKAGNLADVLQMIRVAD